MGQRAQIIFNVPAKYYNEGNPNNRERHLVVYHNQWLYGISFVKYAAKLVEGLNSLLQDKDVILLGEELIERSVNHANYHDILNVHRTHLESPEYNYNKNYTMYNDLLSGYGNIAFLKQFDNNNGYIYIEITDDKKVCYGLLNGLEDADEIKPRTAAEYIGLFYSGETLKEMESFENELKLLAKFAEVNPLDRLNEFKKVLEAKETINPF
jgi:hypothetical protein